MTRARVWAEIKAIGWPVVLYDVSLLVALGMFLAAIFLSNPPNDPRDWAVVLAIAVSTLVGSTFGQAVSVLRVRSTLFFVGLTVSFWVCTYLLVQVGPMLPPEVALGLGILLFIGSIMAAGGFWSLRANRSMAATWPILMLSTGAIIVIAENRGDTVAWFAGNKHAIWSGLTIIVLVVTVVLQLGFLAARESHRVHRWRTAPVATEIVNERRDPIRPLRGCGTFVLLVGLVAFLTFTSAVVAPYLWRTGKGDRDGRNPGETVEQPEPSDTKPQPGDGPPFEMPDVTESMKRGVQATCALFTLVVLALLGLVAFGLPLRRQVLLQHLRNPMWPVPPSRRAHLHWRLAEIALGDAGIHRQPGETALDVARRGLAAHPELNLEALETAARIADRVAYGYALEPSDPDMIGRAAEMTYHAMWESLSEWERLKATYRML